MSTTHDNDDRSTDGREAAGLADVDLLADHTGFPMVVPSIEDDDLTFNDLGDLVSDRIEANGAATFPDPRPDAGDRVPLGTVTWDDRGIPIRLDHEDGRTIHFTPDGGIDRVEEPTDG